MAGAAVAFDLSMTPFALAAVLHAALILSLLRAGAARPENRALAAFFGLTMLYNVGIAISKFLGSGPGDHYADAAGAVGLVDALFLVRFAIIYLRPDAASQPSLRLAPYLVAAAALVALDLGPFGIPEGYVDAVDHFIDIAWIVVPLVLARHAMRAPEASNWRSTLLLGTALAALFASFTFSRIPTTARILAEDRSLAAADAVALAFIDTRAVLLLVLVIGLIVAGARRPAKRRAATAAALTITVVGIGDLLSGGAPDDWVRALAFLLEPVLVAYALLRHQLLGIDLKVKLGLSRGALAGMFLAVFFIVSQVAQNFLQGYGILAGGIATGLLLFAIAPLQRVAERVADRAMPGVGPRADLSSKERAFRNALRFALSDGAVTREEELQLAHLADELGLSTQVATRLRHEVEEAQSRA